VHHFCGSAEGERIGISSCASRLFLADCRLGRGPYWLGLRCICNIEEVIEKMAEAARALGWPQQIVEIAREQMQSITKMQIQLMDHMMDAWTAQRALRTPWRFRG